MKYFYCPVCGNTIQDNLCNKCLSKYEIKQIPTLYERIIEINAEIEILKTELRNIQDKCTHNYVERSRSPNYDEFGGTKGYSICYQCTACEKYSSKDY